MSYRNKPGTNPTNTRKHASASKSMKNISGAAQRKNEDEHQKQPSRGRTVSDPQERRYRHCGKKNKGKSEPNIKPNALQNKSDSGRKTSFEGNSHLREESINTVPDSKISNMKYHKELTQLDEHIEKLYLSERCHKLIYQGIKQGCAYEAVIFAAYFSVDSFLFKYVKEDEEFQKATDGIKIQMMQLDSDPLTFLYAFKSWVESNFSNSWCQEHHIDPDMLNEVKRNIGNICQKIQEMKFPECSNEDISEVSQEFSEIEKIVLAEMLFNCFGDYLCVFSGHYKTGYKIISSQHTAFIHPSSMLYRKENLPQFIIFNKVVPGSRDFLLGITAVPAEMVHRALADEALKFDYSDVFGNTLVSKVIGPVCEKVIKQTLLGKKGNKLQEIEKRIKETLDVESLVIEPSVEKGCVSVFAMKSDLNRAVREVESILKGCLDNSINAEEIHILELKKGEVTVRLEVKCIKGAAITSVKLLNSHDAPSMNNNVSCISRESTKSSSSSVQYSVNLTWNRRLCNGMCYVDLTESSFNQVINNRTRRYRLQDSYIYFKPSNKANNQLFFTGVPAKAKKVDIEDTLKRYLPDVEILKIKMILVPPFETTEQNIKEIEGEIENICERYTNLVNFEVIVPKPGNSDDEMKAYINVSDIEYLKSAAENLSNKMVNGFELNAIPVYRFVIICSLSVYNALESRIEKEIQKLQSELSIKFSDKDLKNLFNFKKDKMEHKGLVRLILLSNDITIMRELQRTVNELLEGEILNKTSVNDIHKLFCHGGHMWLKTLEKAKGVYILEDYNSKIIRIYGSQESCFEVKQCICSFLKDTENEAVERIDLCSYKSNRMLLKAIIKRFDTSLESFVELCELRSAVLDIKFSSISLHGSRESIEKAKEVLDELSNAFATISSPLSCEEMCPVCACPAFNLTSRLEHCGHLYCNECILALVEQSQFPIQCCRKDCSKDIVLDDIVRILGDDAKLKNLLHSSLKDFLERKRTEIIYCPAPDCAMFFYKNQVNGKVKCPLCENDICSRCNVIYHHGSTCEFYQQTRRDPNHSFNVWKSSVRNCKQCPRCKTAIERTSGCDHMTCVYCGAHFCWVCVREFPASEIYEHIPFCDRYPEW